MGRGRTEEMQGRLFAHTPSERALELVEPAPASPRVQELADRLPRSLRLGTSSWSFPGWGRDGGGGLVYRRHYPQATLARYGLAAYAAHPLFRTVGLDRAFYQALSVEEYRELAEQIPSGFRFLVKAHQVVTRPDADESGWTFGSTVALRASGVANALFLDPAYAVDRVIGPATVGLGPAAGPIVFQFPHMDLSARGRLKGPVGFVARLAEFLARLPKAGSGHFGLPLYTVEVRNRELLEPANVFRYAEALRAHGVGHGYVAHPTMPRIGRQVEALESAGYGAAAQPTLTIRWLLHESVTYESGKAKYTPFDRIVDDDPGTRAEVIRLVKQAIARGREAWVIANNKAEGSSPLTLVRLAEAW